MQLGPKYLKQCPTCGKYYKQNTLNSGNTGGATYWTDGRRQAPHLPEYPEIIECFSCNHIFRISKQSIIEEKTRQRSSIIKPIKYGKKAKLLKYNQNEHDGWKEATSLSSYKTSAKTFLKCIGNSLINNSEAYSEKELRILAWRRFNDKFRDRNQPVPIQWAPEFRENAEKLIELLDETDTSEAMTKAEIFRELGEFNKSIDLLTKIEKENYSTVINKIYDLSNQKISELSIIKY